jgi:hypothetical protein
MAYVITFLHHIYLEFGLMALVDLRGLSPPEVNLHGGRHNTRGGALILSPPEVNLHGGRHDTRGGGHILFTEMKIATQY